ncbi:hypothetical protein QO004_002001 [Rhizobium mesoamericanum]|nr:hypothetical protein [Rhizobium mesoamericanum]
MRPILCAATAIIKKHGSNRATSDAAEKRPANKSWAENCAYWDGSNMNHAENA